jgi:hypothetical protein
VTTTSFIIDRLVFEDGSSSELPRNGRGVVLAVRIGRDDSSHYRLYLDVVTSGPDSLNEEPQPLPVYIPTKAALLARQFRMPRSRPVRGLIRRDRATTTGPNTEVTIGHSSRSRRLLTASLAATVAVIAVTILATSPARLVAIAPPSTTSRGSPTDAASSHALCDSSDPACMVALVGPSLRAAGVEDVTASSPVTNTNWTSLRAAGIEDVTASSPVTGSVPRSSGLQRQGENSWPVEPG